MTAWLRAWAWMAAISAIAGLAIPLQQMMGVWLWDWQRVFITIAWLWMLGHLFLLATWFVERGQPRETVPAFGDYVKGTVLASMACFVSAYLLSSLPSGFSMPGQAASKQVARNLEADRVDKRLFFGFWWGSHAAICGSLGMLIYARIRRVRHAGRLLAEAELARIDADARLLSTKVQDVRSHLDPARILAKLDEIEATHGRDVRKADALLDDLIEELRKGVGQLRDLSRPARR